MGKIKLNWSVIILLTTFLILTTSSLYYQNYWSVETEHSCAGYIYLTTGHMWNIVTHGIPTGGLSAIPLLFIDIDHPSWETIPNIKKYCQFEFILYGDNDPELILVLTKIPMILIGLLGGIYVWKWSKELFKNNASGILSLTLYCFFPLVLGYSKSTNLDITLTVFFFITAYYFWKYYKVKSFVSDGTVSTLKLERRYILLTGLFMGLAILSKPSAFVILPSIFFIGMIFIWKGKFKFKEFFWVMVKLCVIVGAVFLVIHPLDWYPLYDFDDPLYMGGDARSEERLNEIVNQLPFPTNITKFALTKIPVPVSHYWQGFYALFNYLHAGNTGAGSGYFKGYEYGAETSNFVKWMWAIALKTPIALFILFGISLILMAIKREKDYLFLLIPMVLYILSFVVVGMIGGVRLLLPAYLFMFVLCGVIMTKRKLYIGFLVGVCLVWYMGITLLIYPAFSQYYNEFIGGPKNAPNYFINADIDAKTDFKMLKLWMDRNNINHIYLNSSVYGMYHIYGINYTPFYANNESQLDGYVAISVSSLYGEIPDGRNDFNWLRELEPIHQEKQYGYSLRVYKIGG